MAKPSAIPLPGVMLVTYFAFYGKKGWNKEAFKILFLPLFAALFLILYSSFVTAKTNPGVLETNILIPLHNIFWYPLRSLLPTTHPFYPPLYLPEQLLGVVPLGVGMAILLLLGMIHCGWGKRKILASFLIIGGLMVPVLGLLKYTNFHYCDRYNYLVSAGVWAVVAILFKSLAGKKENRIRLAAYIFAVIGIIFAVQTIFFLPKWKDTKTLFSIALNDKYPPNPQFYCNGAWCAIVEQDADLLKKIGEKAEKNYKVYGAYSDQILGLSKFFYFQPYVMKGDYKSAYSYYKDLDERRKKGILPPLDAGTELFFCRSMAMTATLSGEKETALIYLERYFSKYKEESQLYYLNLVLKAQLLGDEKLLEKGLRGLVRLAPENPQYKEALFNFLKRKNTLQVQKIRQK